MTPDDLLFALREACNARCSCGGAGPGEGCAVCDVWHDVQAAIQETNQ